MAKAAHRNLFRMAKAASIYYVHTIKDFRNPSKGMSSGHAFSKALQYYLFRRIQKHDVQGREAFKYQDKYYLADHGFREALGFSNTDQIQAVLENIVCNELISRGYQLYVTS